MKTTMKVLLLLLLAGPAAAQVPGQGPGQGQGMQRRAQLEQQVLQRFVQRASDQLALPAATRPRLAQVMREIASDRRQLNQESMQLRRRLAQAVQGGAEDAEFNRLLDDQRRLRQREHELWLREQARLEEILTPRQRAHFTLLWFRLQEDARTLMMQRTPPGPPGAR